MDVLYLDSDSEIYSEVSDSEDLDASESAYGGHAQIILSNLDESIDKIDDFLSFERGFTPGDVVCSIADPSGQLGRLIDINITVDLESASGGVIKGISSKKLARVRSFAVGDYVVHGPWVGRVERLFYVVNVLFDDGVKYAILVRNSETLVPISPSFEDTPFLYYPGQRVKFDRPHVSKLSPWFCGLKKSQDEGTVFHVDVGLVYISWLSSVDTGSGILSSTPDHCQSPSDLTLLSSFFYANWQIGDWCRLPVNTVEANLRTTPIYCTKMQKELEMNNQDIYMITKTKSTVDVLWQDGERSIGLDPGTLSPVSNVGDHEFWPGQFVLEKGTSEDICGPKIQRLGIVKNVDSYERTIKVKWVIPEFKQTVDLSCESMEETVSSYELIDHPDTLHSIGDVVMSYKYPIKNVKEDLSNMQSNEQVHGQKLPPPTNSFDMLEQHIGGSNKDDFGTYLSCIGNVVGYKDEFVEVRWANGYVSMVQPFEIFGVDRTPSPASVMSSDEETFPANTSKEAPDQQRQAKQVWHKKEKNINNSCNEDCTTSVLKPLTLLFPSTSFGFLSHVTRNIFSKKEASQYQLLKKKEELQLNKQDEQLHILVQEPEDFEHTDGSIILPGEDRLMNFNKFDMVNDFSDHHFVNGIGNTLVQSQVNRGWFKKIQQEWSILRKDLPDAIYARVYEERMDLMRAVIVGAPGTPYHDGLFFFDIFFPPAYPHEPPVVHYNSGGLRLNPNLYESGKVCLSLLNTWVGTYTEVWNPKSSTVLQVLLSLQALVLNEKPYFNEAGYDEEIGKAGGEKNSITYNENAFLQSCKSMLYILRQPPKHFEEFVEEHFTKRSHHILTACKAYLDGALVGRAYECDQSRSSSTGFKIMLDKLFPQLIAAFNQIGADCSQFLHLVIGK